MEQLTFDQQMAILSKGVETIVYEDEDCGKISHFHFVGAPFSGLTTEERNQKRKQEIENKRIIIGVVRAHENNNTPLKFSFDEEEGWKMVYELAELNVHETIVAEEVIRLQRRFRYERVTIPDDPYNPNLAIAHRDEDLAYDEMCSGLLRALAEHRNKLIHALNGNIIMEGDTFVHDGNVLSYDKTTIKFLLDKQIKRAQENADNEVDFISVINELDYYENRKKTLQYEQSTTSSGLISILIREERIFATGHGSNKKSIKINSSRKLLQKLLTTYYFNIHGNLNMKLKGILIPELQNDIKENTKRNSKTHRSSKNTRIENLQNKGLDEYAKQLQKKEEWKRLNKIYAKQRVQEQKQVEKLVARLETQTKEGGVANLEWAIPVNVQFTEFQALLNMFEGFFTEEVKKYIDWTDVLNCFYIIYSQPEIHVKWNACSHLRRILGLKAVSVAVFASMVLHVMKALGFIEISPHPKLESYETSSTLSIIITLVLSILYRRNPKASTVEVLINSCKDLPLASKGVALLEGVVMRVCDYVKGTESLEDLVPRTLSEIEETVKLLNNKEGIKKLTTDEKTFVDVCQLRQKIVNLSSVIDTKSIHYQKFLTLKMYVNNLFTIAQRSPVAGCGKRKRPVVTHFWGEAGIGKSRIIKLISADVISTILDMDGYSNEQMDEALDHYDQFIYYRPVGVKYEQNFISDRAKIYVCDDANQVDAKHLNDGVPFPQAIIHLNNEHDHMLPVAEIEMKAQALFKSSLIIATDNKQTPDLSYLQCPEAYYRRIDFCFKMELKEEFSKVVKGSRVVDVSKLDLTQPNEHIYVFKSGGRDYTYDQVIALIRSELRDVHARFMAESVVFKRRAQVTAENLNKEEDIPEYVADQPQNQERVAKIRTAVSKAFFDTREKRKLGKTEFNFGASTSKQDSALLEWRPSVSKGFKLFADESEKPNKRLFESLCVIYIFSWLPIHWADWLNRKLFGQTDSEKFQRKMVLTTIAFIVTAFAGWKIYKKFTKPSKVSKRTQNLTKKEALEKQRKDLEEQIVKLEKEIASPDPPKEEKYNDGPKSVKGKDKKPSDAPIVVTPLFKMESEESEVVKFDVKKLVETPDAQLACPLAYYTEKRVMQNMYLMVLEYKRDGKWFYGCLRGTFLRNKTLVTNRHFFSVTPEEYKTATVSLFNPFNQYLRISTKELDVFSFAHSDDKNSLFYDLIAIKFPAHLKCHVDLCNIDDNTSNFIKMADMGELLHQKVTLVTLTESVEFERIDDVDYVVKNNHILLTAEKQRTTIKQINAEPMAATDPNGETLWTWKTVSYEAQTIPGSCGSILISNSSNQPGRIIGIHMAGYCLTDDSFGQLITYEMIKALEPMLQMKYKPGAMRTILPNSFITVDTVPRPLFMPNKTKLNHSICHGEIFKTTKAPAKLRFSQDEEHGAVTAIKKYLNPHFNLSQNDIAVARAYLTKHFKPKRQVKVLSREVAIRGLEGNEYIQAINRKSSAGYPLAQETKKTGKHEYLGENEEFIYDHPRLNELINEIVKAVEENKRPEVYFCVTMKDELKKLDKLLARIFAAGPLQYTVLFREQYLDYFASMMEGRVLNTSLVGINMLSNDVDVLVRYLLEVTNPSFPAFLAGDFKNFDGTLMSCLLWEIYDVIEGFYGRQSDLTRALWLEITDSRQIFGNAVAHISKGQPSGNPATTTINTMYNSALLHMTISRILKEINTKESLDIRSNLLDHYRLVVYGDDNLMSFSPSLCKILDPKELTRVMAEFGHTYTNDAKDGKPLEYKFISEVSILKRTLSFDSIHGWIAPLDLVSILECLNWDKVPRSKMEQKRAQTIVNMRVAIRELSLHTEEIFDKFRNLILISAERHGLELPPECLFSQDDLRSTVRCGDNLFYFSDDFNIIVDHKLRQGFYLEEVVNIPEIIFGDIWPHLQMKQWSAEQRNEDQSNSLSDQQILTYDKETTFLKEGIPAERNLSEEKFYQFEEIRDHTVKEIVSRVYNITTITIPTGGLPGDLLYTLDPLATLLAQPNVKSKLSKFAAIRTNITIRALITTTRTCSGAIMVQYIPPLGTQRSGTLLQQSQSIRQVIPLATGGQVDLTAPWVDAFLARNLTTTTGNLGTYRITRATPSQIDSIKVKIQIFCPDESLRVEYPTFMDQPVAREELEVERERLDQLLARMNARPTIRVSPLLPRMQMNSLRNIVQNLVSMRPKQSPSDAPITAVKWQPGIGLLNDNATIPMHNLTVNKQQGVNTDAGQFGSNIDEMEVERIMNSENIIGVFPVALTDQENTVLYARPCTITDFIGTTTGTPPVTTMTISHQMFAASMAQQWSAKLNFKICGTHNQLHSYQLRSIFVPEDTGKYTVGQIMTKDDVNAAKGQVHKFGADYMMGQHTVEPMKTTNMKNVPSPRNAAGVSSLANLTANQYTNECSYGMFYIIVEVPLVASAQVAPTVYMYIDFHASEVMLSEAETWLYLLPQTQMKGIEGESFEQNKDKSKSTIIERGETSQTIGKMPDRSTTITQSLGEEISNLKQLAVASTVFANSFSAAVATAYLINPFAFRTTLSQLAADRGQYSDHIDFLFSGYAFYKGGMVISMGKRSGSEPLGEAILLNSRNNFSGATLATPNGIQTITATNAASSAARVQPLYGEECIPRITIPYLQPFNLNRTSTIDGFDNGSNRKHLLVRPYSAVNARFFRAAAHDFTLGFLTSLPQYTLTVAPTIYT